MKAGDSPGFFNVIKRTGLSFLDDVVPSSLSHDAGYFLLGGLMNGFANGVCNAVMMLYVASLGFDARGLGLIFMMNPLSSTLLMIPAGLLADRIGKRLMIIIGAVAILVGMVMFLTASSVETFAISFLVIGVYNATATVFTPIYSSFFESHDMDRAFCLSDLLSITAMSLGSLGGFIPPYLARSTELTLIEAYRVTMMAAAPLFVFQSVCIYKSAQNMKEPLSKRFHFVLKSRWLVLKICGIGLIANIAGGLLFSLFPYYINKKFGVDSAALGTMFFVSNLAMAMSNGVAAGMSRRIGGLRSITLGVALSAVFMMLIPITSSFGIMTVLFILRSGTRFMSDPLLASLFMRSVNDEEKSTANSIRLISLNSGGVVTPMLGGAMMDKLGLDWPAYIGGALTLFSAALYSLLLRDESKLLERANPIRT